MRIKWFAQAAACALVVSSIHGAADAKPKRPAASAAKKAAAAKAAAAKKEADRLAAEAAAKAAAEAAERARLRAQWGVLADLPDGDYDANGTLVTVRREDAGNRIAMTVWKSMARLSYSFSRNPQSGALSYDYADSLNKAHYDGRVEGDGSIEAVMKNETSWPVVKRDGQGLMTFAYVPGKKLELRPLKAGGKAEAKLASLAASGKVRPTGSQAPSTVTAQAAATNSSGNGVPTMAAIQAGASLDFFRSLEGKWWDGTVRWTFVPTSSGMVIDGAGIGLASSQRAIEVRNGQLYFDRVPAVPLASGVFIPKRKYAVLRTEAGELNVVYGQMSNGQFKAADKYPLTMPFLGSYKRMTPDMEAAFQSETKAYEVAQAEAAAQRAREKAASGNSGWLGGLIMGGVVAAAGGNAGMVMGAAMKGVEMTTDNEMTRNVLAGQGDAMIQSSIDTKNMIAETERLRVAAAEETRRKQEAEAAGKTYTPAPASKSAASSKPVTAMKNEASMASGSGGSEGEAYVACSLYGQYEGRKWEFYVSQVGKIRTGYGEAWPDSSDDPISKVWGNYLRSRGADVDGLARTMYPDFPVCHGAKTAAEAEQSRSNWLRDVRNGSGNYTVHEESWAPSGLN